jgi:universal stress protein E
LVAIKDPTARSLPAVDKAVQLARAFGAQLELFHGIASYVYTDFELSSQKLEDLQQMRVVQARSRLEAIAVRARRHKVKVTPFVDWDFPPHEAIIRCAERVKADLIVVEGRAGRHVAPLLLRLTDWELLRFSPVPVLVVKNTRPYRNPTLLAAIDPTHANAKPTQLDDEILRAAVAVKRALRGSMHAMHAFVPMPVDVKPSEMLDEGAARRLEARARAAARVPFDKALRNVRLARGHRHLLGRHPTSW